MSGYTRHYVVEPRPSGKQESVEKEEIGSAGHTRTVPGEAAGSAAPDIRATLNRAGEAGFEPDGGVCLPGKPKSQKSDVSSMG